MLKPSYAELMEVLNKDAEEVSEITSRYTIVIAAAKRARQIIAGDEPMVLERQGKPLSTAVEEIRQGKVKVVPEGEGTVLNLKNPEGEDEYFTSNSEFKKKNDNEIFNKVSESVNIPKTTDGNSEELFDDELEISDEEYDDEEYDDEEYDDEEYDEEEYDDIRDGYIESDDE